MKNCEDCKREISNNSMRCKSCSNKNRKGKYKISKIGRKNISNSLKGHKSWNKGLTHEIDKRIKIKPLKEIKAKKYGMRQQEWIIFSRKLRSKISNCQKCGTKINIKNSEIDHKIPYKISKDNRTNNLWVLCRTCHAKKTYHEDKTSLWGVNN
ncbi:MAG TPA: HNH endonuclease [Candidatus Pacearchaeota archaeon]|nr:HNH endonuclease [Candidatus Pacearchaeota archaeon]